MSIIINNFDQDVVKIHEDNKDLEVKYQNRWYMIV